MSQTSKIIIAVIITAIIVGGGVYLGQEKMKSSSPSAPKEKISLSVEWRQIVQYYCEKSGGTFSSDTCKCPFEEQLGQTSESMYHKMKGTCQTTHGGPGGELGDQNYEWMSKQYQLNDCLDELAEIKNE